MPWHCTKTSSASLDLFSELIEVDLVTLTEG